VDDNWTLPVKGDGKLETTMNDLMRSVHMRTHGDGVRDLGLSGSSIAYLRV
jgi:hypothetical protein